MTQLHYVRETAFDQAKDGDEFAVCCSDDDFEYARTQDEARMISEEMRSMRESLNPGTDYSYEITEILL